MYVGYHLEAVARGDLAGQKQAQDVAHLGLDFRADDDDEIRVVVGGRGIHAPGDGIVIADGDTRQPAPPGDADDVGRSHNPVERMARMHVKVKPGHR